MTTLAREHSLLRPAARAKQGQTSGLQPLKEVTKAGSNQIFRRRNGYSRSSFNVPRSKNTEVVSIGTTDLEHILQDLVQAQLKNIPEQLDVKYIDWLCDLFPKSLPLGAQISTLARRGHASLDGAVHRDGAAHITPAVQSLKPSIENHGNPTRKPEGTTTYRKYRKPPPPRPPSENLEVNSKAVSGRTLLAQRASRHPSLGAPPVLATRSVNYQAPKPVILSSWQTEVRQEGRKDRARAQTDRSDDYSATYEVLSDYIGPFIANRSQGKFEYFR
ncbi:MAG: hypothetical protein M1825_003438 [Sarcosagium campestre]|nr:MAG: hypothetical protein M1825_003438 [Sarcosagium campestre]